jgi:predicted O-linked N-acetylglucosamine transferase (SPINDLY family)
MGVPFVTVAGDRYMARMGLGLLTEVGLGELVARSTEEYVELAVRAARDRPGLAALRTSLRDRVAASRLADAPRFARALEAAYRGMWQAWCTTPAPP